MEKDLEYFKNRGKELEAKYAPFKKFDEMEKERNDAFDKKWHFFIGEETPDEYTARVDARKDEHLADCIADHKWWLKNMLIFNGVKLYDMLDEDMQESYMDGYRVAMRRYRNNTFSGGTDKEDLIRCAREMVEMEIRAFNDEYYEWHWNKYGFNAY